MQPKRDAIFSIPKGKTLIIIKMNYKYELEQTDSEDYKEYTFIFIMLNKGITELVKGSDEVLKD